MFNGLHYRHHNCNERNLSIPCWYKAEALLPGSHLILFNYDQTERGRSTPGGLVEESLMVRSQEDSLDHSSLQDAVLCSGDASFRNATLARTFRAHFQNMITCNEKPEATLDSLPRQTANPGAFIIEMKDAPNSFMLSCCSTGVSLD